MAIALVHTSLGVFARSIYNFICRHFYVFVYLLIVGTSTICLGQARKNQYEFDIWITSLQIKYSLCYESVKPQSSTCAKKLVYILYQISKYSFEPPSECVHSFWRYFSMSCKTYSTILQFNLRPFFRHYRYRYLYYNTYSIS